MDLQTIAAGARNATFEDAVTILREQKARKIDVVAPAETLRSRNGSIELAGLEQQINDDGVTDPNGLYRPTAAADADLAEKLGIGVRYMRKLRNERVDLFDLNVNGLLRGKQRRTVTGEVETVYPADQRSFLLRAFRGDEGQPGMLRAVLSDSYGMIDHLDALTAILSGIEQAQAQASEDGRDVPQPEIRECDLTESFFNVRVYSPQVAALAPTFLGGYANPFENPELEKARQEISRWRKVAEREGMGYQAGDEPVVNAGFRFTNSETGDGKFTLTPELFVRICRNGLTLPAFGTTRVHLGAKLDEGWNFEVQNKSLAVITAQAKQKVAEWLSPAFLQARVNEVEKVAGAPVVEPAKVMKLVAKTYGFTDAEQDGILGHFIAGRQATAAGVANAITSFSQTVPDAVRANALDGKALEAMNLVAARR